MSKADLLRRYIKPIVHMRQQLNGSKFGLVLGSGISRSFQLPDWNSLIEKIAINTCKSSAESGLKTG